MKVIRRYFIWQSWDNLTRFIIVFNGISNLMLGVSFLLWAQISAENVLSKFFSPNFWPVMWILTGIFGVLGLWSNTLARFSFILAGVVMAIFTMASMWAVAVNGTLGAIPTTVFFLDIAGLLWCIGLLLRQRDQLLGGMNEAIKKGQSVLKDADNARQ